MSNILSQKNEARENQAQMMWNMEKKLNGNSFAWFRMNYRRDKSVSKISVAQYWDWITYLDDDYLTDYEVLRMKELYHWQLQELSGQFAAHTLIGYMLVFPLMGPIVKGAAHGWMLRLPPTLTIATFLGV